MSNLEKMDMLVIYAVKSTPQPDSYYALKYGRGVPHVELFNDYKWALEVAKNRAKDREKEPAKWSGISDDVTVEERRYASKRNFINGFTFDQRPCWSTWCDELDSPGRQHYLSTKYILKKSPIWSAGFDDKHYSKELSPHGLICSSREGVLHCFVKRKDKDKKQKKQTIIKRGNIYDIRQSF